MRKALTGVLLAAGALGVVRPAIAQGPPAPWLREQVSNLFHKSADTNVKQATTETVNPMASSQAKLEELQVELALLGNPATFAYPLAAKNSGTNMELCGFVPSNLVKYQ